MNSSDNIFRRKHIKLIFNPVSGANKESPIQLMDVIKELQSWKYIPEPYLTEPDTDYDQVVRETVEKGMRMIVVCGGDGTVTSVARAMSKATGTLGIIPTGTQNNVAFSLGIPAKIPDAVALLRTGWRQKVDIGVVTCGDTTMPFFEVCSIGIFTSLFSSSDDIQHGDLSRVGEFISTLTACSPSKIHLVLNRKHEIEGSGHAVLVSNMPFIGRHYEVSSSDSYRDGLLDVLFCTDVSKLNLMIGYMLKRQKAPEDSRIQQYKVRDLVIDTEPAMPIMADGICLEGGQVHIRIQRHALTVITGQTRPETKKKTGDTFEK